MGGLVTFVKNATDFATKFERAQYVLTLRDRHLSLLIGGMGCSYPHSDGHSLVVPLGLRPCWLAGASLVGGFYSPLATARKISSMARFLVGKDREGASAWPQ